MVCFVLSGEVPAFGGGEPMAAVFADADGNLNLRAAWLDELGTRTTEWFVLTPVQPVGPPESGVWHRLGFLSLTSRTGVARGGCHPWIRIPCLSVLRVSSSCPQPPMSTDIQFGTCSWKYPDWRGLVYGDATPPGDFLREYAQRYETVEIDQWFWSLFGPEKLVLPNPGTAAAYAAAVPAGFLFGVKLPNALTLPHLPGSGQALPPEPNPHFLSPVLLRDILSRLEPLHGKLGPVMLQFGYLNQQAMPSQAAFHERLAAFAGRLPDDYEWAVEIPIQTTHPAYFDLLRQLRLAPSPAGLLPAPSRVYARTRPPGGLAVIRRTAPTARHRKRTAGTGQARDARC